MAVILNITAPCVCCGASGPNVQVVCAEGTYLFPPTLTLTNTFDGSNPPCNSFPLPRVETFALTFRGTDPFFGNFWASDEITLPSPNNDWRMRIVFACFPTACFGQSFGGQPPFTTNLQVTYQITQIGTSTLPNFLEPAGWKCTYRYMGFGFCGYLDSVSPLVWRAGFGSVMGPPNSMFVTE